MKKLLILLIILSSNAVFTQTVRIEGTLVVDDSTQSIGQYTIHSLPDSTLRKGGYLDSTYFTSTFKTHKSKDFYIKIKAFGYNDTLINFTIDDSIISLGTINMNNNRNLKEVSIVYVKPMFERTMDGIKVNVEGTNLQTLNTLFDILIASPKLISPDDESIEIIGQGSPLILIDRQAIISNDELKAVPASMVESIEIITNPSAKYKAQGRSGGVIEVYTKNFRLEGYNMTISGAGGINTQLKPTGRFGMGINMKRKKFSLNGYLGFNYRESNSFGSTIGFTTDDTKRTINRNDKGENWNSWQYYNIKSAYQFNKKHKLTLGVRGHGSLSGYKSEGSSEYLTNEILETSEVYTTDSKFTWLNNSGFINYVWETDTNRSALEVNLNYVMKTSNSSRISLSDYQDITSGTSNLFNIRRDSKDRPIIGEFRMNYEHIFDTTGWKLSFGGSFNMLHNGKLYDQFNFLDNDWVLDSIYSNSYDYNEQIAAVFVEVSKNWDKVGFRLGVRGEYTALNGYSNTLEKEFIDSNYVLPFPSASILLEPADVLGLTFSYSSGIYRPQFSNYDPFVRIQDSLSIEYGNPYLRPEVSHSFGLDIDLFYAYNLSFDYTYSEDSQSTLQFVDDSTFLINSTPWNASHDQSISASLNLPLQLKWLTGWNSIWVNYAKYSFTEIFERDPFFALTYGVYSYLTFKLPGNFNIMNKLSISKWGSSEYLTNTRVSWGLKFTKKMLDNDLQIYLDVSDIFPTKSDYDQFFGNFEYNSTSQNTFTSFKLGVFYKFGRLKQATNIQESSSGQSERI